MESKESEKGGIKRPAEIRAKRRLDSWSEQFKAIWVILLVLWSVVGFFALLTSWIGKSTWIGISTEEGADSLTMFALSFPGLFITTVGWFFYDKHKAWR